VTPPGVHSIFRPGGFSDLKEMNFQNCLNASKIHVLVKLAPNYMKQILFYFLAVDLQSKNIAW
jgi:hypothetical protein